MREKRELRAKLGRADGDLHRQIMNEHSGHEGLLQRAMHLTGDSHTINKTNQSKIGSTGTYLDVRTVWTETIRMLARLIQNPFTTAVFASPGTSVPNPVDVTEGVIR